MKFSIPVEGTTAGQLQRYALDAVMDQPVTALFTRATATGKRIAVVGAGPAGIACAFVLARLGHSVVVHDARPAAGGLNEYGLASYKMAGGFAQAELHWLLGIGGITLQLGWTLGGAAQLQKLRDGFDAVFLGLGLTRTPKLGIPGEIEFAGKGVSYCAICDGAFFKKQTIAVGGGGDAAVEEADFLTRYADKVYVVHRREGFRASPILQERLFANPKIEVIWNAVAEEVTGDATGLMTGLRIRDVVSDEVRTLDASGCFVFIGFRPNTGVINGHFDHDEMGYVRTDTSMQTSIPGLFAAGDLRSQLTRQVTTAVGDATTAAIAVEKYLKTRTEAGHAVTPQGSGGNAV